MDMTCALESVFGTSGRIKVLRALSKAPRHLTGRQVAELSGLTHRGAIQALAGLVEVCAVTQRQVGRAHQYELAEDNIVVEQIVLPVLRAEETLFEQMRQTLVEDFSPYTVSLVLFGSLARGDYTVHSDVDLLAVVDVEEAKAAVEEKVDSLAARFVVRFGRPISVHLLSISELQKRPKPGFLKEVLREGLLLTGQSLEGLIKRGA